MQPIRNDILFKPFPSLEVTESGFLVPENAREINDKGTIVKVGNGVKGKPMRLKEGMIAYRVKGWGEPIIMNDELYFLMDEKAIIATG